MEATPSNNWIEDWVVLRISLDAVEKKDSLDRQD
jgi:hypothetical protein